MLSIRSALVLAILFFAGAAPAVEIYPLDELRPGMRGTGLTVFQGDSISAFAVEILDLVPGRAPFDLVLVRAEGEWIERTGVSQGMSGSPIYVDGKWLGALAYNFGFATEPLALVTPAAAMLALGERAGTGSGKTRADAGGNCRELAFLSEAPTPLLETLEPALPLAVGGMSPAGLARWREEWSPSGLSLLPMGAGMPAGAEMAASGAKSAGAGAAPRALRPGDALAVELLRGPISAAAFGTVSDVAGDRVWAFGHPFLDEGEVELPLAAAWVHSVVPNLASSFKLASVTVPVGATAQDGKAGIFGHLGRSAPMLPLRIVLETEGHAPRQANFELARHRQLQPAMARMALQGWLQGPLSLQDEGRLTLRLELFPEREAADRLPARTVVRETFAGGDALVAPGLWLQAVLGALAMNPAGSLPLDSLSVTLNWRAGEQPILLESLALDRQQMDAGDSLVLRAKVRQGAERRSLTWTLPSGDLPAGNYRLHMGDGGSFTGWNALRQPELYRFTDHGALLRVLDRLESSDLWCLWITAPGQDRVLGDEELSLPVTYAKLMPPPDRENDKKNGQRLLWRSTRPVSRGDAALGYQFVTFTVLPHPKRSRSEP